MAMVTFGRVGKSGCCWSKLPSNVQDDKKALEFQCVEPAEKHFLLSLVSLTQALHVTRNSLRRFSATLDTWTRNKTTRKEKGSRKERDGECSTEAWNRYGEYFVE